MWKTYLTKILCKYIVITLLILITGCASTIPQAVKSCAPLTLPEDPPALVQESKGLDKSKFPKNTEYVKPPETDVDKQRAFWSFEDVDKIQKALFLRQKWVQDAKAIVEGHNKLVGGEGQKESGTSWFRR